MPKFELDAEAQFAVALAHELGAHMERNLAIGTEFGSKLDGSRLTLVDTQNNERAIQAIKGAFPNDGVKGEEKSELTPTDKRRWIVDPVDGTLPFTCGIPTSVILLGLEHEGEPLLGVTYDPYTKTTFLAVRGVGAFINNRRITFADTNNRVTNATSLRGLPLGTTGPDPSHHIEIHETRFNLGTEGAKIQVLGSTGREAALVGAGQFVGQVFGGDTDHDIIAGHLFVQEAGGHVTDARGNPITYDKPFRAAVMSNGLLHDRILDLTVVK